MVLIANDVEMSFSETHIAVNDKDIVNVFAGKNNKSLYDTVSNSSPNNKYKKFTQIVELKYSQYKFMPLGEFLIHRKSNQDAFYKEWLNKYGDEQYCTFFLTDKAVFGLRGLYCYCVSGELTYIGRCRDNFRSRVNQGYGKIHPKNCFIDGQQTNCHLNSLINSVYERVSFFICPLSDEQKIIESERKLIEQYNPIWNIALRTKNGGSLQ